MSKTGKPFSPTPDFDNRRPVALPDLLAGLMNNPSLGQVRPEPQMLIPEVMAPEELMPPATPVNTSMPEFLNSLRSLLSSYDETGDVVNPELPAEAVQDFAHGTNELLNYLLHEVVGAAAPVMEEHTPETVLDFGEATNELLNYLLSQVTEPEIREDTIYTPEAMADFEIGTQDLLSQLLMMSDEEEVVVHPQVVTPAPAPAPEPEPEPIQFEFSSSPVLGDLLGDLLANPPEEIPQFVPEPFADENDAAATQGLLTGLLAGLTSASDVHDLGEVPREYIDESDGEIVERPAGPFEILLDTIDAELPPPPAVRGVVQLAATQAIEGDRFIAFEVGTESYALPFDRVLETDRLPRWTHVPGAAAHLRGVINLRGEIIPLIDLRTLFGASAAVVDGRMVVVRDVAGKASVAFVVDRLLGLASVPANEISHSRAEGVVRGVATASGRKVGLIDADLIMAAAHGDQALPRHTILINLLEERTELCLKH